MVKMDTENSPNTPEAHTSQNILHQDKSYHSNSSSQHLVDPFQCTLQITAAKGEANFLKNLYLPLLEGIDPTFQLIRVEESEEFSAPHGVKCNENNLVEYEEDEEQAVECPALSVVLFLREAFGRLSAISVQKNLTCEPWKFHHRIELPKDVRPQVTARQDYYQSFSGLPLWSVCPVHYGNEHLRFHIVVKDFLRMRSFYELITGMKAREGTDGFCYISIYIQKGLDIQLSLKSLPQIVPKPSSESRLRFKIPNIESLLPYLARCPVPVPNEKGSWLTNDPDGNVIVLEETAPCEKETYCENHVTQETSDYKTGSVETE